MYIWSTEKKIKQHEHNELSALIAKIKKLDQKTKTMVTHHQRSPSATTVVVITTEMSSHHCKTYGIMVTSRDIMEIVTNRVEILEE